MYIIEEKLTSRMKLREVYDVKDANGNLLGYVNGKRFKRSFWFENLNGIHLAVTKQYSTWTSQLYDALLNCSYVTVEALFYANA